MESGIDNVIDDNMEDKGIWITNNARDEILEQDNPEALKQRYDAIYDLWKFRHSDFAKADPERPFWERFNPWRKKEPFLSNHKCQVRGTMSLWKM